MLPPKNMSDVLVNHSSTGASKSSVTNKIPKKYAKALNCHAKTKSMERIFKNNADKWVVDVVFSASSLLDYQTLERCHIFN
jgi:hypothetical protein